MKMKKIATKIMSLVLVVIMVTSVSPINAFVTDSGYEALSEGHALVMQSDHLSVAKRKTIQMTATVTNVDVQPEIIWSSSDESIATVDSNGKVKGVSVGRAVIFAQAEVDGETLTGSYTLTGKITALDNYNNPTIVVDGYENMDDVEEALEDGKTIKRIIDTL